MGEPCVPRTNYSGGIQAGISNGEDIYFRVAFKPVSTIVKEQDTVDIHGEETRVKGRGRHDPCVLPRASPSLRPWRPSPFWIFTCCPWLNRNKKQSIQYGEIDPYLSCGALMVFLPCHSMLPFTRTPLNPWNLARCNPIHWKIRQVFNSYLSYIELSWGLVSEQTKGKG